MRSRKSISRGLRRIYKRTPSKRIRLYLKKRKPKKARCRLCKTELKGVPRERNTGMKNLTKTKKRPERPYSGNLCSRCMRKIMIEKARAGENA